MKFTTISATLGLVAMVSAADVQSRDLATTTRVMNNVLDQMIIVEKAVGDFWTSSDMPTLAEAGTKMLTVIGASDTEVCAMTPVPLEDAMNFLPLSDKLNTQGDSLLGSIEKKIPVFGTAGVCPIMYTAVQTMGTDVVKLMNDVSDKFPQQARQNNGKMIQHFTDSFASVVDKLKMCASVNKAGDKAAGFISSKVAQLSGMHMPTASAVMSAAAELPGKAKDQAGAAATYMAGAASAVVSEAVAAVTPIYTGVGTVGTPKNASKSGAAGDNNGKSHVVAASGSMVGVANGVAFGAVALAVFVL